MSVAFDKDRLESGRTCSGHVPHTGQVLRNFVAIRRSSE